ncbi:S9 family peptidase [Halomarina ordinaria]|uniref:Prolyl oligopeptidase family serine peptidase n=1 Tax=Halomarina ordinaria TaxID=3033939 RepID=A0ABD5UBH2_9EURY|nr:S9 family peptidase [Halomarina sp. PSRA2]
MDPDSPPLAPEALYDVTQVTDLAVSPGGERVAFLARECDPDADERRTSLLVVPTDGSEDPHRLTRASDASAPKWSPDGTKLAFLAVRERDAERRIGSDDGGLITESIDGNDGQDNIEGTDGEDSGDDEDGDDGEDETQVWAFDLSRGGDARQLTDRPHGVADYDWSPDGERLVVAARDPTDDQREALERREAGGPIEVDRLQHKADGAGWLDDVRTYLFVVDPDAGKERRLDATGFEPGAGEMQSGRQPRWGGDDRIAFLAYESERPDDTYERDVYLVDPAGGDPTRLTDGGWAFAGLTWNPSGTHLAVRAGDPENPYRPDELQVLDASGERRSLAAGLDRTLGWDDPAWLDDRSLLATLADEGWTRLARADREGTLERTYRAQSRDESVTKFDAGDGTVVVARSHAAAGTDLHALAADALDDDPDPTRLTALNTCFFEGRAGHRARRVAFDSGDQRVEGIALYPTDFDPDAPDPRPLLLDIHGGPMAYDQPGWDFDAAFWTSRGYVVFRVNYRGSTSYGRAFSEALRGRWNTLEVDDLLAGTDHLVEEGWADPDRLFVTGFSQGGINTAYVLTRTDRFAAGAAEHGIYDLASSFGTDDCHNWLESDFGLPWENPGGYREASSLPDVDAIETPLLLTAGEEDWRCPPTQSEQLYVSLRKRGVPAKLVVYQGEHHAIEDPERAVHRLRTLADWFETHDPATETGDRTAA